MRRFTWSEGYGHSSGITDARTGLTRDFVTGRPLTCAGTPRHPPLPPGVSRRPVPWKCPRMERNARRAYERLRAQQAARRSARETL